MVDFKVRHRAAELAATAIAPQYLLAKLPVASSSSRIGVAMAVAPSAPPFVHSVPTKPPAPAPKAEPSKLKKPKEVYYNIVGEPVPFDED